jgi:hypothetical protein
MRPIRSTDTNRPNPSKSSGKLFLDMVSLLPVRTWKDPSAAPAATKQDFKEMVEILGDGAGELLSRSSAS